MTAFLTPLEFVQVRQALDVSLTPDDLPDGTIALPIYAGAAEQTVLALLPDAATRTGPDLERVRTAAALFCAALLAEALPRFLEERILSGDYSYKREPRDAAAQAAGLRARARAALSSLVAPSTGWLFTRLPARKPGIGVLPW